MNLNKNKFRSNLMDNNLFSIMRLAIKVLDPMSKKPPKAFRLTPVTDILTKLEIKTYAVILLIVVLYELYARAMNCGREEVYLRNVVRREKVWAPLVYALGSELLTFF
ncbi:hypothetical protein RF11_00179 [Thelohanellus kitauei]|uniref:Uncharacterized protein n=1 Tax=Thelohanellus kitauei TaxID=669202 RepID=A0A0C2IY65_THEKT|nr:hypothetical protein RF11_00179 [Thelohanellus kitauei]